MCHSSATAVNGMTVLYPYEDISLTRCLSHGNYVFGGKMFAGKFTPGSLPPLTSSVSTILFEERSVSLQYSIVYR